MFGGRGEGGAEEGEREEETEKRVHLSVRKERLWYIGERGHGMNEGFAVNERRIQKRVGIS